MMNASLLPLAAPHQNIAAHVHRSTCTGSAIALQQPPPPFIPQELWQLQQVILYNILYFCIEIQWRKYANPLAIFIIAGKCPKLQVLHLQKSISKGLNSEGWQLSPSLGWSCNQVCLAVGLSCSEAEQHAHNADVSYTSGIQSIMITMEKTCLAFNTHWGTALDVPGIKANDECFTSSPSRTASEYSCSRAQQHMYRLCYCSSQD